MRSLVDLGRQIMLTCFHGSIDNPPAAREEVGGMWWNLVEVLLKVEAMEVFLACVRECSKGGHACEPAGAADSLSPQRAKLPTTYLQRAYYMITSCFCVSGRHRRACTCILPGAVVLQCQVGSPCLMHLMAAGAVLYVWFSAPALQPFRYSNSSANLALSAII